MGRKPKDPRGGHNKKPLPETETTKKQNKVKQLGSDTKNKTHKLNDKHIEFICQKIGEEVLNFSEIVILFNNVYDKGRNPVRITRDTVDYYSRQDKYKPLINDCREALNKTLDQCKYVDLGVAAQVITKTINECASKGQAKEVYHGFELLHKLTGKLVERTENNTKLDEDQYMQLLEKLQQDQKRFLQEYDPAEDEDDDKNI